MPSAMATEKRMSQMAHTDLPLDRTRYSTDSVSRKSSKRWRPSWMSTRPESTRSRGSSRYTTSTIHSRKSSVSTAASEVPNAYQLPVSSHNPVKPESGRKEEEFVLPNMRYEFEDEAFEFPIPAVLMNTGVKKKPEPLQASGPNSSSYPPRVSSRQARGPPRAVSTTAMSTSRMTVSTRSTGTSSKRERNPLAEIEMASKEKYGYWRASLTARVSPAAAMCGCALLTARLSSRQQPKNITTTDNADLTEDAYNLCNALEESPTPDQALQILHDHSSNISILIIALQASIESTSQLSPIPDKIAAAMYEKVAKAQTNSQKRINLFSSLIKLLQKLPPDTLVILMFLLSISQRLQAKTITIDHQDPALFLLRCLFPASLALSPDRHARDGVARLLSVHFDAMPADLPVLLEGVNYRFVAGKKVNFLRLVADGGVQSRSQGDRQRQRQSQKLNLGPKGIREIDVVGGSGGSGGIDDRHRIQW